MVDPEVAENAAERITIATRVGARMGELIVDARPESFAILAALVSHTLVRRGGDYGDAAIQAVVNEYRQSHPKLFMDEAHRLLVAMKTQKPSGTPRKPRKPKKPKGPFSPPRPQLRKVRLLMRAEEIRKYEQENTQ